MKQHTRFLFIVCLAMLVAGTVAVAWAEGVAYRDGKYKLDYKDAELGKVTVQVLVEKSKISAISLPSGMGDVTLDEAGLADWVKTLIASPNYLKVDAIAGATQSCDLLRYAVQAALKKAIIK